MMYSSADAFVNALTERKIAFRAGKLEQHPNDDSAPEKVITKEVVEVTVRGDYDLEMKVRFLFDANCINATAAILDVATVPEEKMNVALKLINDFNVACRVIKYLIVPLRDDKGTWRNIMSCRVDLDFDNNAAVASMRALDYLAKIGNRNYPRIQKELFGVDVTTGAAQN